MKNQLSTLRSLLICLLIFLCSAPQAFATDYYLDATGGNNLNNGTDISTPWQSVTKINGTTFVAGDTINFKRGETFTGKITLYDDSGASGNPITFGAYGTGADPILSAGDTRVLDIRNSAQYLTFENLDIQNATADAIFLFSGTFTGLQFINIDIASTTGSAFIVSSGSTVNTLLQNINASRTISFAGQSTNDTLENVTITGGTNGLQFSNNATSTNLVIDGLTISGVADGLWIRRIADATISDVTISNVSSDGIWIQYASDDSVFSNLQVSSSTDYGFRHNGVATNLTIGTSTVNNNGNDGIYLLSALGNTLIHNVNSGSNTGAGLSYSGGNSDSEILIASSTFNYNGDTGTLSNGLMLSGSGLATTSSSTANFNSNDGFNIRNTVHAAFLDSISEGNGVDGLSSDGDGYSWHDSSTGYLTTSLAKDNKKGGVTNVGTSDVNIYNNIFTHDSTGTLASIWIGESATGDIYNNTLINLSQEGDAIKMDGSAAGSVQNNLIHGFDVGITDTSSGSITYSNNLVYNTGSTAFSGFTPDATSLTSDPRLTDVAGGDYTLTSSSPAINAGTTTPRTADYIGNSISGIDDIGAYEYQGTSPTASFTSTISGLTVSFSDSSTDPDGTIASRLWNFGDSVTSTTANPSHTYAVGGSYTVTLVVTDNHNETATTTSTVSVSPTARTTSVGGTIYGCKDKAASNYEEFVSHDQSLCRYDNASTSGLLASLLAKIYARIAELQNTSADTTQHTPPTCSFNRNLQINMTGNDVTCLQKYLNSNGFILTTSGVGAPGSETSYFGAFTKAALTRFQNVHAAEILSPLGLLQGTGYFGASTRAFINQ